MDQIKTITLAQVLSPEEMQNCIDLYYRDPRQMHYYITTDPKILGSCRTHDLLPKYFAYMVEYAIESRGGVKDR